jgi:hypothetical protein
MQSFPGAQRPQAKMSPRSSLRLFWKRRFTAGLTGFSWFDLGSAARLVWILGLSRTAEGKRPWKQGRSARLESHCVVILQDRHAYIQAHGERYISVGSRHTGSVDLVGSGRTTEGERHGTLEQRVPCR